MRTTLNLDEDVIAELKQHANNDGVTMTAVVNQVLRQGLHTLHEKSRRKKNYKEEPVDMGVPIVNMDKALYMSTALEDEEILRKMDLRK